MKKLLLALMCVSSFSYAKDVAYMENGGGGKMIITNEKCMNAERTKSYDGMWRIYTYNSKGDTTEGCFEFESETIHVFWPEHKKEQRWPISAFTLYEKK